LDQWIDEIATSKRRLSSEDIPQLVQADISSLMSAAAWRRDQAHGNLQSFSRKVFLPLTRLCRDVCHYCTFAKVDRYDRKTPYMSIDKAIDIASRGAEAGCKEALFTLGDKPELRYAEARLHLEEMGHTSTLDYLAEVSDRVLKETGLLPHLNAGIMTGSDLTALRAVSVSMGLMLESDADRLCERGGVHYGSPDKQPNVRLKTIELAGVQKIPFTTGILVGIGETRRERISALLKLRALHDQHGHLQEIIIQNFLPKAGTRMERTPALTLNEHLWTIAVARLLFDPEMTIQAPPNLSAAALPELLNAGINDWGGISPITPDHVNPEAPWPQLSELERATNRCGRVLTERLAIFPQYARNMGVWTNPALRAPLLRHMDGEGYARAELWAAGSTVPPPTKELAAISGPAVHATRPLQEIFNRWATGEIPTVDQISTLFRARGDDFTSICQRADALRAQVNGSHVSFVINRNINYTNICNYRCQFCAFAKGKISESLRGTPYVMELDEIKRRVREAVERGATEICMQGGIHPSFSGKTYLEILGAARSAAPEIHIHAFSPLEVMHGATTLSISVREFLEELKVKGLNTLPGTAAEILHDPVRRLICPDKVSTQQWLEIMRTAHQVGLRSTSTIMFGHVEGYKDLARHLLALYTLQRETGGFTEFVPLPFVHMESPIYRKGNARKGPSFREAILMHAIGRLMLHPWISNIQASWVKMGLKGVHGCLLAGANDLGGTLMNESISRAAGAAHGQELDADQMREQIRVWGRIPLQRTTLYGVPGKTSMPPQTILLSECINLKPVNIMAVSGNHSCNS
jgi:FO synthase